MYLLAIALICLTASATTARSKLGPLPTDPGSDFLHELVIKSPPPAKIEIDVKMIETETSSLGVLYADVPMSNLAQNCFKSIPLKYRERCLVESFERFSGSVYPSKARCCTKWHQIECLEKYAFNALYCDTHQRVAVSRYFKQVKSTGADGSPECTAYRPISEEIALWSSSLGRVAKCATSAAKEPILFHSS